MLVDKGAAFHLRAAVKLRVLSGNDWMITWRFSCQRREFLESGSRNVTSTFVTSDANSFVERCQIM
jgi:hypothetical protein